jgi:aspartate racemase
LVERGAQGVILGCTEISMLIGPADCAVLLFDTTQLHAVAASTLAIASD